LPAKTKTDLISVKPELVTIDHIKEDITASFDVTDPTLVTAIGNTQKAEFTVLNWFYEDNNQDW
jgi:hypothetical protein